MSTINFKQSTSLVSVRILTLPVPAVVAHLVDAILSLPAQLAFSLRRVAVASGNVASATRLDRVGNLYAINLFKSLHHIQHAVTVTSAEIVDSQSATAVNGLECSYVAFGKVDDVDIIAHAGTVGSVKRPTQGACR